MKIYISAMIVVLFLLAADSPSNVLATGSNYINSSTENYSISASTNYQLAWVKGTSMIGPRYSYGAVIGDNGKIYVIGGDNYSCTSLKTNEEFDPNTNTWTAKADMPTGRWSLGVAKATNGMIYTMGGGGGGCASGQPVGANEEYNPLTNTWTAKAAMPTPRINLAVVAASNGKVYAIGGQSSTAHYLTSVEEYDPATDTWRSRASLIVGGEGLSAVELNGKIYVIGERYYSVEEYNPVTNQWTLLASLPAPRISFGAVAAWNNRIYAIAGNFLTWTNTVFEFDPSSNSWRIVAPVQVPRRGVGAVIDNNGKIYIFGGWGPGGIGYEGEGPLSSVEVATISEVGASKPIVVLVHGWAGFPGSIGDDCNSDTKADPIDLKKLPAGDMGILASHLINDGWEVWNVHIKTSPSFTPPIEWNAVCLRNQLQKISIPDRKVVLLAHSMGGLVSRAYMENTTFGFYRNDVSQLITLGTPHAGTSYGLAPCLINPGDYAACQFSLLINSFNSAYSTRARGAVYDLIGGDLTPIPLGAGIFLNEGYNDGVVGAQSGIGRKYHALSAPTTVLFENNFSTVQRFIIPASHISYPPLGWFPSYFSVKDGDNQTMTATYACIRYLLGIPGGICPSQTNDLVTDRSVSTPVLMQQLPSAIGHLASGETASGTLPVDQGLGSEFDLTWDSGKLQLTLTDPNGTVIDPTYALNHPEEVSYYENMTDASTQLFASYIFTSTATGDFTFNLLATETPASGLNYNLQGYTESDRQLTISTDNSIYKLNDTALITATLKNVSTDIGIPGATIEGEVYQGGSNLASLQFTSLGNGIYTATHLITEPSGIYGIRVKASGIDSNVNYARQEDQGLIVQSSALSLTGANTDNAEDLDGNGKYEVLRVSVGVNVNQAGDYLIYGDLYDTESNFVAHGVISTTLPTGMSSIKLPFLGNDILSSHINGPYILTNINVLDQQSSGVPVIYDAQNIHTTASYEWPDFASDCFTIVTSIEGQGIVTANPPPNCNHGTQYVIGTDVSLTAIPYPGTSFVGWSGDVIDSNPVIPIAVNHDFNTLAVFTTVKNTYLPSVKR